MKEIKYNLIDIDDSQFAVFPEKYVEGKEMEIGAIINIASSKDGTDLKCDSRIELKQDGNLILVTEISCKYKITEDSWEDVDENKKKLPSGFIRHIASLAIGTQRGIVIARTKDTPIHKIILPAVNIAEIIKKDYVIDIVKTK